MARGLSGLLEPGTVVRMRWSAGPAPIRGIHIARSVGSFVDPRVSRPPVACNRLTGKGMPSLRLGRMRFRADFRQAARIHVR